MIDLRSREIEKRFFIYSASNDRPLLNQKYWAFIISHASHPYRKVPDSETFVLKISAIDSPFIYEETGVTLICNS